MRSSYVLAMALALASVPAAAVDVIDQEQSVASFNLIPLFRDIGQTFKQTAGNISGAGIYVLADGYTGSDTLQLTLWSERPVAGGQVVAGANVPFTMSGNGMWVDAFWAPVAITPETTYYLNFFTLGSKFAVAGAGNVYSRGNSMIGFGYTDFLEYDVTFRTFSSTKDVGGVPEPATWGMMIAGFGLVGAAARRRRPIKA